MKESESQLMSTAHVNFKVFIYVKNMLRSSETKQMPTLTGTTSIKHMELSKHFPDFIPKHTDSMILWKLSGRIWSWYASISPAFTLMQTSSIT